MQRIEKNVWDTCMELIQSECYEQVFNILESKHCAMAILFKGKVHLAMAEKIVNSFSFRFYPSVDTKNQLHQLLMKTYNYYFEASAKKDLADPEKREFIGTQVIVGLDKLDGMLNECVPEPLPEGANDVMTEVDVQMHTENITQKLSEWNFESKS